MVVRCEDGEGRGWWMGVGKRKGLVGLEEGQALALVAGGTMDRFAGQESMGGGAEMGAGGGDGKK